MDWFSWLSATALHPSLVYEYGLIFTRNELQVDDVSYFNHEFLKSMGISVAKHRLEILKIANKEKGARRRGISKLFAALTISRKSIKKCIGRLVSHQCASKLISRQDSIIRALPEPARRQCLNDTHILGTKSIKEFHDFTPKKSPSIPPLRRQSKSGPLERRMPEHPALSPRSLKLSGPLDVKVRENMLQARPSPRFSGNQEWRRSQHKVMMTASSPLINRPYAERFASPRRHSTYDKDNQLDEQGSVWSALFQDLKPT